MVKFGNVCRALAILVLTVGAVSVSQAKTYTYKGKGNQHWEKTKLKPGDVVVVRAGTYNNLRISVQGKGTPQKPIIVKAEKPGAVVLTGASWLRYWGTSIVVDGFDFTNNTVNEFKGKVRPLIANRKAASSSTRVFEMCNGCVLQNVRIDNEAPSAAKASYKWFEVYGFNNVIRYNYFGAKQSASRVLQIQLKHAVGDSRSVSHHIHHNYFASRNVGNHVDNGGEAILIGESKMQHVDAKCLVEKNLFVDASIHGEPEVLSNKSSSNTYQYNTIRKTTASLTLRHGNKNTVRYNWFLQDGTPGSGGIRVIGKDNQLINNYIDGAAGAAGVTVDKNSLETPAYKTALGLVSGYSAVDDSQNINGYQLSERNVFSHNSVIRSAQPVMLAAWYDRGKHHMSRPPKTTSFTDNLVLQLDVPPLSVDWVRAQAISVDFTTQSNYAVAAEYDPTFAAVSGNISDSAVSPYVAAGTKVIKGFDGKACDAFATGDMVYDAYEGAGADLSKMSEPLVWSAENKSAKLGPAWLNGQWADAEKSYTPCAVSAPTASL